MICGRAGRRSAARSRSPSARSARGTERSPRASPSALPDLPLELVLCERSAGLAAQQRARLPRARHVPLDELEPVTGAIIANEVHDACPAHALRWPDELLVAVDDRRALRLDRRGVDAREPAGDRRRSGAVPADGPRAAGRAGAGRAADEARRLLARGALYVFDYGEAGPERYLRRVPRLRTYLGGGPGGDPLSAPGSQDITVDVDFGALRSAGEAAGLRTVVDEPQPAWLRRHGASTGGDAARRRARSASGSKR